MDSHSLSHRKQIVEEYSIVRSLWWGQHRCSELLISACCLTEYLIAWWRGRFFFLVCGTRGNKQMRGALLEEAANCFFEDDDVQAASATLEPSQTLDMAPRMVVVSPCNQRWTTENSGVSPYFSSCSHLSSGKL